MLKEVFEMHGFRVYTASNGREGVDLYKRHQPNIDLVILDMLMPVMDGKSAYREIKQLDESQKVIIISGYSKREDLQEMLSNESVSFMSKPFQLNDIIEKVEEVLKK